MFRLTVKMSKLRRMSKILIKIILLNLNSVILTN